jgi:ferredoxin-NADP reductase
MQRTAITQMERISDGVVCLTLKGVAGPLAGWDAGAHIDVELPNWLTRQYSLCGDLDDRDHYRIAVRHHALSRGGSEYINLFLHEGQYLDVSLPRNHFRLEPAPSYLFVAGGIGVTPMVSMMQAAAAAGVEATLLYVGKTRAAMPFATELRDRYGEGEQVILFETDHHRRPDFAAIADTLDSQTSVYCCGPESMVIDVERAFSAEATHVERFQPATKSFAPNTEFHVLCARSKRTIDVAADSSLLDALLQAGYRLGAGCREGVCGSCELGVLDGQPEHRDDIGAPEGRMYACVSRSLSPRLVLDL